MNYGEILEKAWKIIWKHKVLWIFGFFAGCLAKGGGGGGSSGPSSVNSGNLGSGPDVNGWFDSGSGFAYQIEQLFESGAIWAIIATLIFGLICFFFLIFIISLVLGTFGKIGLIKGAWLADEGQEKLKFSELWRDSTSYFWRVLLLFVLRWLLSIVLTLVLILPVLLVIVFTLGCGLCLLIPVLIALSWFITILFEQSIVAIVGEDLSVMDGLRRGWQVLTSNLLPIVLMAIILLIGSGIIGLLIGLPVLFVLLPAFGGILIGENVTIGIGIALSIMILLIYIPIAIVLSSVLQAYLGTAWTLVFRRMTGKQSIEA